MKIPEKSNFLFTVRLTPKRSLIAVVVGSLLTFLTARCGVSQEDFLRFYNEIRKGIKFDLLNENNIINEFDRQLNDRINKDPKLLEHKVRSEVTDAIARYERLTGDDGVVRITPPRYSEKDIDTSVCYTPECQALGGEIRLCSPWALDCPSESVVK